MRRVNLLIGTVVVLTSLLAYATSRSVTAPAIGSSNIPTGTVSNREIIVRFQSVFVNNLIKKMKTTKDTFELFSSCKDSNGLGSNPLGGIATTAQLINEKIKLDTPQDFAQNMDCCLAEWLYHASFIAYEVCEGGKDDKDDMVGWFALENTQSLEELMFMSCDISQIKFDDETTKMFFTSDCAAASKNKKGPFTTYVK